MARTQVDGELGTATGSTTRHPSPRWAWPTAALALVVLVGAVVWGLVTYDGLQDRLDALHRTAVPGQLTLEVEGPAGLTIFYEDPDAAADFVVRSNQASTIDVSPVDVSVTGPSGPVTLARYERDLRFDVDGRVATALATFDAPEAGRYTLDVAGDAPAGAMVAVGDVVDASLMANAAGAVVLFVASLLTASLAVAIAVLGRGDARRGRSERPRSSGRD